MIRPDIEDKKKIRGINPEFINDLKEGKYKPVLEIVKQDRALCLEIRRNYINIYYQGGNILKIIKVGDTFKLEFDYKYISTDSAASKELLEKHKSEYNWNSYFPLAINIMNNWFSKHPKKEKFIQQAFVFNEGVLKEYIITDFEYQKGKIARFDLMGIRTVKDKSILSFIEIKQGYTSLRTKKNNENNKQTSGLKKHLQDILQEIKDENDIQNEIVQAQCLFNQKQQLGIISQEKKYPNKISANEIEVLFVIADYQTKNSIKFSTTLADEIKEIEEFLKSKSFNFKLNLNIQFLKTKDSEQSVNIIIEKSSEIVDYLDYKKTLESFYS